jgi:hypothetical protein
MKRYVEAIIFINTSAENVEQEIESIFSSGAETEGFAFETINVDDSVGVGLGIKLTKEG